mgnify:CR=1 FL=1
MVSEATALKEVVVTSGRVGIFSKERTGSGNPMYGRTGKNCPSYGKQLPEKTKEKLRIASTGKKHTKENIERMKAIYHLTENHNRKMIK